MYEKTAATSMNTQAQSTQSNYCNHGREDRNYTFLDGLARETKRDVDRGSFERVVVPRKLSRGAGRNDGAAAADL